MQQAYVTVIRPDNYIHTACFYPVIGALEYGFNASGYKTEVLFNKFSLENPNIIVGAHLLTNPDHVLQHNKPLIYNFEQISEESGWLSENYVNTLRAKPYFDYSKANITAITSKYPDMQVKHLPFAYSPTLDYTYVQQDQFKVKPKDIDVLFFGSINDRRTKVLNKLKDLNLNVIAAFGVYGADLSSLIHRAKIVLNMHYYESSVFEAVRVLPLLASRVAVVSEKSVDDEDYKYLGCGIMSVPYETLAYACKDLIEDEKRRDSMAETGYANLKLKTMTQSLESIRSML
jgi:hypothetical protein